MRRALLVVLATAAATASAAGPAAARDRPFGTSDLVAMKWGPLPAERDLGGTGNTDTGGRFNVGAIEAFRCASAGGADRASST